MGFVRMTCAHDGLKRDNDYFEAQHDREDGICEMYYQSIHEPGPFAHLTVAFFECEIEKDVAKNNHRKFFSSKIPDSFLVSALGESPSFDQEIAVNQPGIQTASKNTSSS